MTEEGRGGGGGEGGLRRACVNDAGRAGSGGATGLMGRAAVGDDKRGWRMGLVATGDSVGSRDLRRLCRISAGVSSRADRDGVSGCAASDVDDGVGVFGGAGETETEAEVEAEVSVDPVDPEAGVEADEEVEAEARVEVEAEAGCW